MRPALGVVLADRYELERPLAQGGMGAVWLARHRQLDAPVAVKLMRDDVDLDPLARARFEREAKAAARLASPHVARVFDYGVEDGTPFLVMERLVGESLEQRLKREGRLSPMDAARVLHAVAKGLREAHAAGLVHRDLKPANLFLAQAGGEEVPKILDFGIAKETHRPTPDDERTEAGALLGSPHHMSPEQARGEPCDARSDLFSLGVVAYRMLVGARPFEAPTLGELLVRIATADAPPPSRVVPSLGAPVDAFFARALARDPGARFASVDDLVAGFDAAVAGVIDLPARGIAVAPRADATLAPRAEQTVAPRADATREAAPAPHEAMATTADPVARTAPQHASAPRARAVFAAAAALGAALAIVAAVASARHDAPLASADTPSAAPIASIAAPTGSTAAPTASSAAPLVALPTASAAAAPSASAPPVASATPRPRRPAPAPRATGNPFF
jgi:serine/threonine-protein kinase